jgi:hypothetical protein
MQTDAGAAWDFPSLLPLTQEWESRLVQTEDRARLLPNTVLALGSSGLFKDKAPCGCASIRLGPERNARRCTVTGDEVFY